MVRTLVTVLGTRRALSGLFLLFPATLVLLFLVVKHTFILNLIAGDFPLWLFSRILPSLAYDFLLGNAVLAAHFVLIAFLLSTYLLLAIHLFRTHHFSIASIGTSIAGVAGISLGVTCISCGALVGIFLVSVLGVLSLPVTLIHHSSVFLVIGELLLATSIVLVLYTITKFEQ